MGIGALPAPFCIEQDTTYSFGPSPVTNKERYEFSIVPNNDLFRICVKVSQYVDGVWDEKHNDPHKITFKKNDVVKPSGEYTESEVVNLFNKIKDKGKLSFVGGVLVQF